MAICSGVVSRVPFGIFGFLPTCGEAYQKNGKINKTKSEQVHVNVHDHRVVRFRDCEILKLQL
jgi:hypothetical protein